MIEDTYDDDNNVYGKPINSNSDNGNKNDNDTFHAIQAEIVIDETYDDDDNVNRKLINNVIDNTDDDNNNNWKPFSNGFLQPVGKQKGAVGIIYEHEAVL